MVHLEKLIVLLIVIVKVVLIVIQMVNVHLHVLILINVQIGLILIMVIFVQMKHLHVKWICTINADCRSGFLCDQSDYLYGKFIPECGNDGDCQDQAEAMGVDSNLWHLYACNYTGVCYYTPDACDSDSQCRDQQWYEYGNDLGLLYGCNVDGECYYTPDACSFDYQCQNQAQYEYGLNPAIVDLYACNTTSR